VQTAQLTDGQSQTGHSKAQDAVEVASMKALASTVSLAQLQQQHPDDLLHRSLAGNVQQAPDSCENDSTFANVAEQCGNELDSGRKDSPSKDTGARSLSACSAASDAEVDSMGDLNVSHVQEIMLPASAQAMFDCGEQLGVWLAWRMPGMSSTRSCLRLMSVHAGEVCTCQNGSLFPSWERK
jgi:hypothetical protein